MFKPWHKLQVQKSQKTHGFGCTWGTLYFPLTCHELSAWNLNGRVYIEKGRKKKKRIRRKKKKNILAMANYQPPEHAGYSPSLPSARMSDSIGDKLLLSSSSH